MELKVGSWRGSGNGEFPKRKGWKGYQVPLLIYVFVHMFTTTHVNFSILHRIEVSCQEAGFQWVIEEVRLRVKSTYNLLFIHRSLLNNLPWYPERHISYLCHWRCRQQWRAWSHSSPPHPLGTINISNIHNIIIFTKTVNFYRMTSHPMYRVSEKCVQLRPQNEIQTGSHFLNRHPVNVWYILHLILKMKWWCLQ